MFLYARLNFFPGCIFAALVVLPLQAESGDVENSHDYPGFDRLPDYVIGDYDEDNPGDFNFIVARPSLVDSDHIETVHAKGHRYVIRYDLDSNAASPSLLQIQRAYEKMAVAEGFTVEKTGAVGDVTETFHQIKAGHEVWVSLAPSITSNVLTIVESNVEIPPTAVMAVAPVPQRVAPPPAMPETPEDPFYTALVKTGRVALPLTFLPAKPDLDVDSQPVLDRVAAMMRRHPVLLFKIEGHTDNLGDAQASQRLSEQRAITVRALLLASHVDKKQVTAEGLGGSRPIADNQTEEGRAKNRRIELVLRRSGSDDDDDSRDANSSSQ